MIVQCVALGEPAVPDGTPLPISVYTRGINNNGAVLGFVTATYNGASRIILAAVFLPDGAILTFGSPFGFTQLWSPIIGIDDGDWIYYAAANREGYYKLVTANYNTSELVTLPDLGTPKQSLFFQTMATNNAYGWYGIGGPYKTGGAFVYRDGTLRTVNLDGYDWLSLLDASDNSEYKLWYAIPKGKGHELVAILDHRGKLVPYERTSLFAVNDSGQIVGCPRADTNRDLMLIKDGVERRIDLAREFGKDGLTVHDWAYINGSGLIAGSYRTDRGSLFGGYVIWKDEMLDLMTTEAVRSRDFDSLWVEGLNENNQLCVTGRIAGQAALQAYRIDIDVNDYAVNVSPHDQKLLGPNDVTRN